MAKYLIRHQKEILLDLDGSKFAEFCEILFNVFILLLRFHSTLPSGSCALKFCKMKLYSQVIGSDIKEVLTFLSAVINSHGTIKTYKYKNTHLKLKH